MSTIAKQQRRKGRPLNVWIDEPLRDAIDKACELNRRNITEEVAIALEEYLAKMRLWPPHPKGGLRATVSQE